METKATKAIKIFYSYAHEDKQLRDKLEKHFTPLRRQGYIAEWHDQAIPAGALWESEIDTHLDTADIILLLVSSDFIASNYCWSIQMEHALERHKAGNCRIVPIILRPIGWKSTPLGDLQVLPRGGQSITKWPDQDEALENVAEGLREIVTTLLVERGNPQIVYAQLTDTSPTFSDQLDHQTDRQWRELSQAIFFEKGAYHICVQGHNCYHTGWAQETDLSNFVFQVKMTILEGCGGGMTLRGRENESGGAEKYDPMGYRFSFSRYGINCVYGETTLLSQSRLVAELNRSYLLTTIARGNSLSFYIDKQYIATVTDSRASSGRIGLMSWNAAEQDQAHVIYRNAQIWDLTNNNQW